MSDMSLNTRPLSGIQLCQLIPTNLFFPQAHYRYSLAFEELKLHAMLMSRHRLDALFHIQVYLSSKFYASF
jgi:hypothetical protein